MNKINSFFLTTNFNSFKLLAIFITNAILTVLVVSVYPGTKLLFLLSSTSMFLMLLSALYKQINFGYLFLIIGLWVGFFIKICVHMLLKYPYVEPIGHFDNSLPSWDIVMYVVLFACLGVCVGKFLFEFSIRKYFGQAKAKVSIIKAWYLNVPIWIWLFAIIFVVGINIMNLILGIHQIGLIPRTVLPWPINALIAWQINIGNTLLLSMLLWWRIRANKNVYAALCFYIFACFLSSITLFSRGIYIFHTLPVLLMLNFNKDFSKRFSRLKLFALDIFFLCLFLASISITTNFRDYFYTRINNSPEISAKLIRLEVLNGGIPHVQRLIAQGASQQGHLHDLLAERTKLEKEVNNKFKFLSYKSSLNSSNEHEDFSNKIFQVFNKILSLSVDRWIGIEAVMSLVAYPDKSYQNFFNATLEKRELHKVNSWERIFKSNYEHSDISVLQFSSSPGAVGYFYLSGSMFIVFFGMMIFTLLLLAGEELTYKATKNPLFSSVIGVTMASTILGFGNCPSQLIPYYSLILLSILFISIIQSERVYENIRKFILIRRRGI
jgi:hypothetical protein